jgi:RNA polymerase sigma-70 factor (ECF subfamily)
VDPIDAALIEAVQRGEDEALGTLLSRHAPGVYRFGLKMCRDPEDAKDVVQDTLLAAARGIREFRGASSLSTWLYTIARSFCIKKRRGAMASAVVSLDDEPGAAQMQSADAPPDAAAASHELGAALESAIASLDPMYREVLLLRDVEGLGASEVAEVLELTVDAVKSRLHRARADVRGVERSAERRCGDRSLPGRGRDVLAIRGGGHRRGRLRGDGAPHRELQAM